MKKPIKIAFALFLSTLFFACNNELGIEKTNPKIDPPVYYSKMAKPINCQAITVGVNFGIFYGETTVYYCCAGDWCIPTGATLCHNCGVVGEEEYNDYIKGQSAKTKVVKKNKFRFIKKLLGFYVQDLIKNRKQPLSEFDKARISLTNEINIINSTVVNVEGNQISIKKGKYKIDKEGFVTLKLNMK